MKIPFRLSYAPQLSQDGRRIAARGYGGGGSDIIAARTLPGGKLKGRWPAGTHSGQHEEGTFCLSPDGRQLAILNGYTAGKVWDADKDRELLVLETQCSLRLSRDGRYLLTWHKATAAEKAMEHRAMRPTLFRVYDLTTKAPLSAVEDEHDWEDMPQCIALADEARLLVLGQGQFIRIHEPHTGKTLSFKDPRTKKRVDHFTLPAGKLTALALDGPGTTLAYASDDGSIRLIDSRTGAELAAISTDQTWLRLALSPSGNWLAAGDKGGLVRLWNLAAARAELRQAGLDWRLGRPQ